MTNRKHHAQIQHAGFDVLGSLRAAFWEALIVLAVFSFLWGVSAVISSIRNRPRPDDCQ